MASLLERSRARLRGLWRLAKSERATPREIGWAVGIGVFVGATPALGVHGWIALGAATLFRKNRLFCWLGSRVSNVFVLPWIVLAEIQVAHRIRTGEFLSLRADEAIKHGSSLLLDWCIGTLPVGGALGVVLGLAAFAIARARQRKKAAAELLAAPESPESRG